MSASPQLLSVAEGMSIEAKLDISLPSSVNLETVTDIVTYLYEGSVYLTSQNVSSIEYVAELLQFHSILGHCKDFREFSNTYRDVASKTSLKRGVETLEFSSQLDPHTIFVESRNSNAKASRNI